MSALWPLADRRSRSSVSSADRPAFTRTSFTIRATRSSMRARCLSPPTRRSKWRATPSDWAPAAGALTGVVARAAAGAAARFRSIRSAGDLGAAYPAAGRDFRRFFFFGTTLLRVAFGPEYGRVADRSSGQGGIDDRSAGGVR